MLERKRNYRDLVAGGLLILVGLYIVVQAAISLRIGVLARMGPGLFPVALGVIMTTLGLFISVAALFRSGPAIEGDLKSLLWVCAGMLLFGVLVGPFGLMPAALALVLVASRADARLSLVKALVYGIALALVAALVFRVGLSLRLPLFSWPW